jgi:hypothetical protein
MRQLVVEVPAGELANLEKITLIEAKPPTAARQKKRRMKITVVATAVESNAVTKEQRKHALGKAFGILKGRADSPQDGLLFQAEMRAE